MSLSLMILSVAAAVIAVAAAIVVLVRHLTAQASASSTDAIEAAVRATLAERGSTAEVLERDRDATVLAAVARASEMADAKLDARLRQGTEQLNAGSLAFQRKAEDMAGEVRRLEAMVRKLSENSAGQHGAVVSQLEATAKATHRLQQTTGGLREALASSKARGQWGERMAEDVLRAAGFVEGLNYETQKGIESGGRPDVTFMMPRDMVLHMDVKFPIDNYIRFLEETEAAGQRVDDFRKQFVHDARSRVKELATRRYHEAANSVDTVVLFIPNESVFAFVQECVPTLMDEALASKIVLCGPSTLFAVLAVVRQAMDNFLLERRSDEIMGCLQEFRGEWEKFSDHLDKHGKHVATAQKSFDELSGARTNQLQRKVNRIDELQASRVDLADDRPTLASVRNLAAG